MNAAELIDTALELLVVPSFSTLGYRWRRRLFDWSDPVPGAMLGKTALVTGATSGLGLEIASRLASLGARVILVGRSLDKLSVVRDDLAATVGEDRFPLVIADLSSRAAVRRAIDQVLMNEQRLDILVDNAGGLYAERRESADGLELTLALIAVGPFMLTAGLLPLLRSTAGSRVIAVTSGGMYTQAVDLTDLQSTRATWSGPKAYARAKRIQVALIREWARRTMDSGIGFFAMHPGWTDTPGLASSLPTFYRVMRPLLRSPAEGADTAVWLAAAAEAPEWNGRLFLDRKPRPFDRIPSTRLDAEQRAALWRAAVELAEIGDPAPDRPVASLATDSRGGR